VNKSKNDTLPSRYPVSQIVMALNYRRSHTCFGIIISIWLFHVSVLLIIIPKNFMLVG